MNTLVCLGFGYSAQHYVALHGARFDRIIGTTRTAANAAQRAATRVGGLTHHVEMIRVRRRDGRTRPHRGGVAGERPPGLDCSRGRHRPHAGLPERRGRRGTALTAIVYLSTIAVYGNHDGAWIDEDTPLAPALTRAQDRIEAEHAWQALGAARCVPVAVIRIAGIYGPGQNALETVKAGRARRIVKPGQVFNRIHVDDLAEIIDRAVALAVSRHAGGVFNAADDEPTAPGDPIAYAAGLLGVEPPPEIAFAEARKAMSPFAISFYGESKRVRNARIKSVLGVTLRYPTYREGLRALAGKGS